MGWRSGKRRRGKEGKRGRFERARVRRMGDEHWREGEKGRRKQPRLLSHPALQNLEPCNLNRS